jgi:hypothetical protein
MAQPARVRAVLSEAGFSPPNFAGCTEPMYFGRNPQHAFQFMIGLAGWMVDGSMIIIEPALSRRCGPVSRITTPLGGVACGSAAWLVAATRH